MDLPSSSLPDHGSLILLLVLLIVSPCDNFFVKRMLLSFARSLPHWTIAAWVCDPTIGGLAWPEGAGVQGLSRRTRGPLAGQEEQLDGVLAIGCGPLRVQRNGEASAHLVQGEIGLELPALDGVHANGDVGSVVHPPPDKVFMMLRPCLFFMMLVFFDVVVGVALGVSGVVVAYLVLVAASCYVFLFCLVLVLLLCCVVFDL